MSKNRFRHLTPAVIGMITFATFGHTPFTVVCGTVFVAGVIVICAEWIVTELRRHMSSLQSADG
ncbi:MAG: hypothetical protein AAF196_18690 [Planctomycetota bacterium]